MSRLLDWANDQRNRLLSDSKTQNFLSRFPLTRWVARKRAKSLFDLTVGFVYSQILYSCIKLDLLGSLRNEPRSIQDLAELCDLPQQNMVHLVEASIALGLMSRRSDGQITLGESGAALLGNPGVAAMILHHDRLYADLENPVVLLQQGSGERMSSYWPYANNQESGRLSTDAVADYSALMASSQSLIAGDVLDAFSFRRVARILDVAGGEGAFICAALSRWDHLEATLLDLPPVAALAEQRFSDQGVSIRATARGGNMFKDDYPGGHDLVSLVRVLHDHDDDAALNILARCHDALEPGGCLLIAEPMAGAGPEGRAVSAYFHFYLMAMGSGRPRTEKEISVMLEHIGFSEIRAVSTSRPLITRMVTAKKV